MKKVSRPRRITHRLARWFVCVCLYCTLGPVATAQEPQEAAPHPRAKLAGSALTLAEIERHIETAAPRAFNPVGNSSVVFQMRLAGEENAAFKPRTRTHPAGDGAEVAAYRIGRALGMPNVVPAVPRVVALSTMQRLLSSDYQSVWPDFVDEMISSDGANVRGAAIYWVPDMRDLGVDTEDGIERWSRWLAQDGAPPYRDKSKVLAREISEMILFDFLIGNWDRFSGANAQGDSTGHHLLVRDHNVAFYVPLPETQQRRLLARLKRVQRVSRRFVAALKAMDAEALSTLLVRETDPPGYEPLSTRQQREVLLRRRTLLSYIAALTDQYGQERVLWFP